jgi:ribose-phosphate pyrophosphokinase
MPDKIFFACPQMANLMAEVAVKVSRDEAITLGNILWKDFKDGWPNLFVENAESVKGMDVFFFASFDNPAEAFKQIGVLSAFWFYQAKTLTIILPFFPTATMERVEEYGQIATAKTLARQLSSIPACYGGFPRLLIFDPHTQDLPFYFERNSLIVEPLSAMPLAVKGLERIATPAVAFPDSGSWKRFGKNFADFPTIICDKVRGEGGKRIVTIKEGDPRDKQVLIVDDLTRTGGTLEECRAALVAAGAYAVSAFVTHGAFNEGAWKKLSYAGERDDSEHFLDFVTTDSCPIQAEQIRGHKPFKVLSLAGLVYNAIKE